MTERRVITGFMKSLDVTEDLKRDFMDLFSYSLQYIKKLPLEEQKAIALRAKPILERNEASRIAIAEFLEQITPYINNLTGGENGTLGGDGFTDTIHLEREEE